MEWNNQVQEIEEENATPTVKVNSNQALEHLKSLKIYFQANPSNCSDYLDGIMKMENFIANEMNKNKKQDVIENYFIKN